MCDCGCGGCNDKTPKSKNNFLPESVRTKLQDLLKEEITKDDEHLIRAWIRSEVASILFDLYKKRSTWQ